MGHVETLSAVIAAGAGPLVRGVGEVGLSFTALHRAASQGYRTCVAKLLEAGAPVNSRHELRGTALTEAVQRGQKGAAVELLAAGADVNKIVDCSLPHGTRRLPPYNDCTPLCIAAERNDSKMVKVLLEAGADPAKGPTSCLPLHMAARLGSCVMLSGLLQAGASVSSVDADGRSALHLACAYNRPEAVDLLRRHNSSVVALCISGLSPMDVVGTQALAIRQRGRVPTHTTAPTGQLEHHSLALLLRDPVLNSSGLGFGKGCYPMHVELRGDL